VLISLGRNGDKSGAGADRGIKSRIRHKHHSKYTKLEMTGLFKDNQRKLRELARMSEVSARKTVATEFCNRENNDTVF
jgi:hypothetical protein